MEQALQILKSYFGYETFREGQKKIIQQVLKGTDTLGILPTGGGKSICYQVPAMIFSGVTVVISPLISLMKDQVDTLNSVGIPATYINSSLSYKEQMEIIEMLQIGEYKLLYIAPERLENEEFLQILSGLKISLVAVDEAHCISQWGHDFRPSYTRIHHFIASLKQRPKLLALTATATNEVQNDICSSLQIEQKNTVFTSFIRDNLAFSVIHGVKKQDYIAKYVEARKGKSGIIYAATRKTVDFIYELLKKKGVSVSRYHGGMTEKQRTEEQERFLYENSDVMVATNAFGMGIDKPDVRYVIHAQMPNCMEAYYQEAGRAGRDGEESECVLLFAPGDVQIQRLLLEDEYNDNNRMQFELSKLQHMKDYCHKESCLLNEIISYFGEQLEEPCDKCSNCLDKREKIDVTVDAQKVLSCIIRLRERYGKSIVSAVLAGSNNKKIKQLQLTTLPTYGIMKELSIATISSFVDFLLSEQYIQSTMEKYPTLYVTEKGREVLKGIKQVEMKETVKVVSQESEPNQQLFERLRACRRLLAEAEGIPPFIVCSDATLKSMCVILPTTNEEMLFVKGIGIEKNKKYGQPFIEEIVAYIAENPTVSETETMSFTSQERSIKKKVDTKNETFQLVLQGKSIEQIAKERELSTVTIENHIVQLVEDNEINLSNYVTDKEYEAIKDVALKQNDLLLKPIKEELNETISYFQIKLVVNSLKNEQKETK